jgi:transcriptional regulator
MYVPSQHEETDLSILHALIRAHPLGTWVTQGEGELVANHIPFFVDHTRGERGTLVAHVARANPVWKLFSRTVDSVVIFQGAEQYISPSWYPSKQADGKVVPTWNYAVVHAHGVPRTFEDKEWLSRHLNQLVDSQEASRTPPWKVSDAPADYIERMMRAIVGIEIPIARLQGKWKVSQNRTEPDRLGVVAGLLDDAGRDSQEMASLVQSSLTPSPAGSTPG